MFGTILTALKIIGIVFAVIPGLVILIIGVVLFVPVRYKFTGNKGESKDDYLIEIKASWLLHLIGVKASFRNGKLEKKIGVLFFDLAKDKTDKEKKEGKKKSKDRRKNKADKKKKVKKAKCRKKQNNKDNNKPDYVMLQYDDSSGEIKETDVKNDLNVGKPVKVKPDSVVSQADDLEGDISVSVSDNNISDCNTSDDNASEKLNVVISEKISTFISKIVSVVSNGIEKIKKIYDDFDYYRTALLDDDRNRRAISKVIANVKKLLKAIMPGKLKGMVEFGFDDPGKTGKVLTYAACIYPWIFDKIQIKPDFENEKMILQLEGKGRIFLITPIVVAIRVYFNKDVKRFIRIMKKEEK